jgi:tetratricopeptide (TPR) repeat protein
MNVVCGDPLYRPYARGPGTSLGEDGRGRDYALYQGIAMKHQDQGSLALKRALTDLAESRSKPHLLELTALLSASEGKNTEAIDLLEHAESLYVINTDKARAMLYLTELYRKEGQPEHAKKLLQRLLNDNAFANVPGILAAKALLEK